MRHDSGRLADTRVGAGQTTPSGLSFIPRAVESCTYGPSCSFLYTIHSLYMLLLLLVSLCIILVTWFPELGLFILLLYNTEVFQKVFISK